jgi:hypothetical protein
MLIIYINYFNFMHTPFHLLSHLSEVWNYGVYDSLHYTKDSYRQIIDIIKKVRRLSAINTIACIGYSLKLYY